MLRTLILLTLALTVVRPANAYIAVVANRLTLSEVMLEFPTVVSLRLTKMDAEKGAFVFEVMEVVTGTVNPKVSLRFDLGGPGKIAASLKTLKVGDRAITFLGSVDRRSLTMVQNTWFISRPDQGWERFDQLRPDFSSLYVGEAVPLADAVRSLDRGGFCRVNVQHEAGSDVLPVQYDAQFPHRRFARADRADLPQSADAIRTALKSKRTRTQYLACAAMIERPSEVASCRAEVTELLDHRNAMLRAAAVEALIKAPVTDDTILKRLSLLLEDEDRFVCALAARAIAVRGQAGRTALPGLVRSLGDRNYDFDFRPHRAAEAAEAILTIAPDGESARSAVRLLTSDKMLNDDRVDSEGTRTAAARALGRCGTAAKPALPALEKRLSDTLPATRIAVAEAILRIGGSESVEKKAREALKAAVTDPHAGTAVQAIRAAADCRCVELADAMRSRLKRETVDEVRRSLTEAISTLGKANSSVP